MIRNWVPASMIRLYGFHDEYKGRLAAFEKRIYPFHGWQCGQTDGLCREVTKQAFVQFHPQVSAGHLPLLSTKKITSPTATTAAITPPISGQLVGGFSSKLAVME